MAQGMEMVQHGFIDCLQFSFLIVGHTKFDVDRMFSATAKAYNASDVSTLKNSYTLCLSMTKSLEL